MQATNLHSHSKSITTPYLKTLTFAVLLPFCTNADTILLHDDFEDGSRFNQDLPDSAEWFASFNNLRMAKTASREYSLENAPVGSVARHGVAYFAPSDAPVSLADGETLTVSFNVTPTSRTPENGLHVLRVGVLHSGSEQQKIDNGNADPKVSGYGFFINPADQRIRIYGRTDDAGPLFSSLGSGNGWAGGKTGGFLFGNTPSYSVSMTQDKTYKITVAIKRLNNDDLDITYTITEGDETTEVNFVESDYLVYDFDTIAFAWGDAFGDGLVDNVTVTHTTT